MGRQELSLYIVPKLLSFFTTIFFVTSLQSSAFPAETKFTDEKISFSDLDKHIAQQPAINNIVAQGIMRPVSVTQFAPDAPVSLGEFAVSLQHMLNLPPPSKTYDFVDVSPDSPIYGAVQAVGPYLGRQALCPGCALQNTFDPYRPLTVGEAAVTLVLILMSQKKLQLLTQGDADRTVANIPGGADLLPPSRLFLGTALKSGLIALTPDGAIKASQQYTRADFAVLLDRTQTHFQIERVRP